MASALDRNDYVCDRPDALVYRFNKLMDLSLRQTREIERLREALERLAAPVGWDMAMCQEEWGAEGEAKYQARMLLFSAARQ